QEAAFTLIRELVLNAERHSRAAHVEISVASSEEATTIRVHDDGVGMDAARLAEAVASGHVGLASLRARVDGLGGTLAFESTPGDGVDVTIRLPTLKHGSGATDMPPRHPEPAAA